MTTSVRVVISNSGQDTTYSFPEDRNLAVMLLLIFVHLQSSGFTWDPSSILLTGWDVTFEGTPSDKTVVLTRNPLEGDPAPGYRISFPASEALLSLLKNALTHHIYSN